MPMRRAAIAALVLLLAAGSLAAQERRGTPGAFDFYVLALSWSPFFCDTRGRERNSPQCETGRRLGFVVHGLWPQYERGYPSNCSTASAPAAVVDASADLYPDPGLARHEWRVHGTCSGLTPAAYFAAVKTARDLVTIPDPMVGMTQDGETTPVSIERAFSTVNRGLRPDMMAVTCRRGALQEVRICLTRDLRGFRSCPEVDRQSCRFGPLRVRAPG